MGSLLRALYKNKLTIPLKEGSCTLCLRENHRIHLRYEESSGIRIAQSYRINSGLLRGDYETRMKSYAIGIQNGFMSPNDGRRLEDMNLIPTNEGGDSYLCNGNIISVKKTAFGDAGG